MEFVVPFEGGEECEVWKIVYNPLWKYINVRCTPEVFAEVVFVNNGSTVVIVNLSDDPVAFI